MENFVNEHIGSIIVAVVFLIVVAVLYFAAKGKYRKVAKQIMLSLVVTAEERFGDGTGKIKFSYVVDRLYEKLPVIVQIVFSEKEIENMIEDAVAKMKEFLADHPETSLTDTEKEIS
jgi:hypothetical protein